MIVHTVTTDFFDSNVYLFERNGKRFMIDCGGTDTASLVIKPDIILLTHAHIDHILSLRDFKQCDIYVHKEEIPFLFDPGLNLSPQLIGKPYIFDGDYKDYHDLPSEYGIKVIHTPGHTPGSVSIQIDEYLFSGDTLFLGGIGNTSFPLGNEREERISLQKLFELPPDTIVFPGHGARTTIGQEKY